LTLLVLGGTAEARQVADALGAVLSLAGAVRAPLAAPHRIGGFGGVAGLTGYLKSQGFTGVIDATHPFAAQMSHNACAACAALSLPLLRLQRPAWRADPDWKMVQDLTAAARAIPTGARAFLSVGRQSLTPFLARGDVWFLTRSIELAAKLPTHGKSILQRPPFSVEGEQALMLLHAITHLVSKNAGGAATRAKLKAAQQLGVQVIMVERPPLPVVLTVETLAQAVAWAEMLD